MESEEKAKDCINQAKEFYNKAIVGINSEVFKQNK